MILVIMALTWLNWYMYQYAEELGVMVDTAQDAALTLASNVEDLKGHIRKLEDDISDLEREIEIKDALIAEQAVEIESLEKKAESYRIKALAIEEAKRTYNVIATAYTKDCKGCSGITATGLDIRSSTPKIIAVDPKIIPLHSKVELFVDGESWGIYTAEDTGGAIKGHRIDILMDSKSKALDFGVKRVTVKVIPPEAV
jgi:3D (Asp-Asp-Asp) domain-containing protein